jgi:uncharacterized lipoprotein YajG
MRTLAIAACALTLAACATTEETVPVAYAPKSTTTIMAGASGVKVTVVGADTRTTNRGRISTKINGYGMEMAAIRSQQDVGVIVQDALSSELKARGYTLAPGGPTVNAAVETFYADFGVGVLAGKAEGDVKLNVRVTDPAGAERYRQTVQGASKKTVQLASGKNAAAALSEALSDALSKLFGDAAFLAALR